MKSFRQTYTIHAPVEEVWQALVNPQYIREWSGSPAKMDDRMGTRFSLWGDSIWGMNTEVVMHTKLVQEWYSQEEKEWNEPSLVTFTLHEKPKSVELILVHTNIPDEYAKDIEKGWKDYYLGPIKEYLESKSLA